MSDKSVWDTKERMPSQRHLPIILWYPAFLPHPPLAQFNAARVMWSAYKMNIVEWERKNYFQDSRMIQLIQVRNDINESTINMEEI